MKPVAKYEKNMIKAPVIVFVDDALALLMYSKVVCSDKKLPIPIDSASTRIRINPVKRIVDLETFAAAIPERSPPVDTKLSSTPNMKFFIYNALVSLVRLIEYNSL